MSIRVRRPTTDRLELSEGDYLIVKRDLTAGEYGELMRAASRPVSLTAATSAPGVAIQTMDLDPIAAGVATVLAYLLDWSFQDADGKKILIADQPPNVIRSALGNIDSDAYMEVQRAVLAHQQRRADEISAEKKTRPTAPLSDATLASVG